MVKEKDEVSCSSCGRFIKKLAEICPYCGAKPDNPPKELMEEKIEKDHLRSTKNIRYQRKDKHYGNK